MSEGLRDLAAYDAMRAQQVANVRAAGGEHHDEATDALIADALRDLIYAAEAGHQGGKIGCECLWCAAVRKGRGALAALGK